ncbi:MAG: 5-formyltetrahydrofolate cyclo-ligase [Acutalibacteraceae bacterium]
MKKELRRSYKVKRDSLENRDELSKKIADKLIKSDEYKNAHTILLYYSVLSEVSTKEIFKKALSDGKKVAFPLCLDNKGLMEFYLVTGESDLVDEMYCIKAPDKEKCLRLTSTDDTLCVVPGLAFDKSGMRLGYGKGYYDRFLSHFKGVSVGLCYESTLSEKLPQDENDEKINLLITDKKVYKF